MFTRYDYSVCSPTGIQPLIVLKFGSSVLDPKEGFNRVVLEIYREIRAGKRVLAVVSALPGVTDQLIQAAHRQFDHPHPDALANLVSTGEMSAAAFLGMALDQAGIPALVLDADRAGLEIRGTALDSDPVDLDVDAIYSLFDRYPVMVLPGFIGRTDSGSLGLMGRGGSDLTALFAAHRLGAGECRLLKDVDGLYANDPRNGSTPGCRYTSATWSETRRIGGKLVQDKAAAYAEKNRVTFSIATPLATERTVIGPGPVETSERTASSPPLRVSLLGLGAVGLGLYHRLITQKNRFRIMGIAIRHPAKTREVNVPPDLLFDDPWLLLERPTDVVVELIGGKEPAASLIRASLGLSRHVVTANKYVMAHEGFALSRIAQSAGVELDYSASVGGAVPVIERVGALACSEVIERFEGVLNGTCNYVLDRMAEGMSSDDAIAKAQEKGFAEADPRLDLNGKDSVHKLAILTRAAFGVNLHPSEIFCRGIENLDRNVKRDHVMKLVASCQKSPEGIRAEVRPTALPAEHPLAGARDEENRILVETNAGTTLLQGKGAGRWPTSLAVMADLLDIAAARKSPEEVSR